MTVVDLAAVRQTARIKARSYQSIIVCRPFFLRAFPLVDHSPVVGAKPPVLIAYATLLPVRRALWELDRR